MGWRLGRLVGPARDHPVPFAAPMRLRLLSPLLALFALGCAREALPTMPEWSRPSAAILERARPVASEPISPPTWAPRRPRRGFSSLAVPDGDACVRELSQTGAGFH